MSDDLRSRILAAVEDGIRRQPHGVLRGDDETRIRSRADGITTAVMPVVEGALWRVENTSYGKCRWCYVLVVESWAKACGKEVRPHRMTCRFYVGPVEHRAGGGAQSLTHWSTSCSCGRSYDAGRGGCENAAEAWRGPAAA